MTAALEAPATPLRHVLVDAGPAPRPTTYGVGYFTAIPGPRRIQLWSTHANGQATIVMDPADAIRLGRDLLDAGLNASTDNVFALRGVV